MSQSIFNSQTAISKICKEAGVIYLALFGSHARGEETAHSDIDLLVEFKETPGLVGFIRLKQKLEKVLGKKIDLVTKNGLSKYIKPYVQADLRVLYG